jgi:YegS/Rv2252/BmrU family lipid kinase
MPAEKIKSKRVFIIINPVAGFSDGNSLKNLCEQQFTAAGWQSSFYLTKRGENLVPVLQKTIAAGVDLVVAVGGDGTVAAVAAGLLNTEVPLGIIPTGTWNAIARHLYLPALPVRAIALMTGKHEIRTMDMMTVGDTIHAMNVGVGFSAKMNDNASREVKRKMGASAYLKHFFKLIFGLEMQKYVIQADGFTYRGRANEIFIANYGVAGLHLLEDRLDIHPDDGKVDILIMRARTILDLPVMMWQMFIRKDKRTPKYRQFSASRDISITTRPPSPVQADGELVGMTPISVTVLPCSIQVIVPMPSTLANAIDGIKMLTGAAPEPPHPVKSRRQNSPKPRTER